jgi:hypothetical protein
MHLYKTWNGPAPTTAAQAKVATGTAIKTMLQIATPSTRQIKLVSWGFSIDASQGGTVELLQTDVAATVTAHVAAGVQPLDPNAPASLMTLGTSATGYTGSAEGSITATRMFDAATVQGGGVWMQSYSYQFTAAERAVVAVSKFLRVRATFGTSTNMLCWIVWDE